MRSQTIHELTDLALLKINGGDAQNFLQGQLTNDINLLNNNWQYTGYCNPKGRLLALFRLWQHDNSYYLLLSSELVKPISQRLTMFVMRSKVVIEHINSINIYGLTNLENLNHVDRNLAALVTPDSENNVFKSNDISVLQINKRYLVLTSVKIADCDISQDCTDWQALDIKQGIPQIVAASSELFIPQMINLDKLGGISFSKGCYTGQEIIARLHYLGKLKQRMFVFNLKNRTQSIAVGDEIYADAQLTKTVGNVVSGYSGCKQCLAVIRLEFADQSLYLKDGSELVKFSGSLTT